MTKLIFFFGVSSVLSFFLSKQYISLLCIYIYFRLWILVRKKQY